MAGIMSHISKLRHGNITSLIDRLIFVINLVEQSVFFVFSYSSANMSSDTVFCRERLEEVIASAECHFREVLKVMCTTTVVYRAWMLEALLKELVS
jgi:hypothetical protein